MLRYFSFMTTEKKMAVILAQLLNKIKLSILGNKQSLRILKNFGRFRTKKLSLPRIMPS
jgi:hypothetical protein